MRFTGQSFVQLVLTSLAVLPSLISAQAAVVDKTPRYYFTPVVQNDAMYIMGGSDNYLDVRFMNLSKGLDIGNVNWTYWSAPNVSTLTAFGRGVAYPGQNGEIFVQGGNGSSTMVENLVKFFPSTGNWEQATPLGTAPPVTSMMTASYDVTTGIAYYYGGMPLAQHEVDKSKSPINTFSTFNTKNGLWNVLNPNAPNVTRPGRISHTSTLVNNQLFIMGGQTYGANATSGLTPTGFQSVLVYDIDSNTAISVETLGDIPAARQSYSATLGLDGKSIVIYGGYLYPEVGYVAASNDVYVLDTCTLTWSKKSAGGSAPGPLFAHGAVTINNYMVVTLGKTSPATFNDNTYILDMNSWKWVNTLSSLDNTIAASTCKFVLPQVSATDYVPYTYDRSVLANPTKLTQKEVNKKGFGIGFGLFAVLLIAGIGAFFYMRRVRRKKARTLNPRWMRNTPTHTNNGLSNDRDYPLFVYNKELDNDNSNNPNRNTTAFAPNGVRTYTASDHEQWENQLNKEPSSERHSDIWQRMRGLNDNGPAIAGNEGVDHHQNNNNTSGKLLDV